MTSCRLSEDGKTVIVLPGTKKCRDEEYVRNTTIERVLCTEDMEEIGYKSFQGCTSLTFIELKSGLKKIGPDTFLRCTQLTHVSFVDGMEEIGDWSFLRCTSLRSIELKPGLKKIGYCTFFRCTQLTHVSFVDGMEEIGEQSFKNCTSLRSIELKPGLKRIGTDTFEGCDQLTTIIMSMPCSDSQQLIGQIRNAGALHLKNMIVSRPLTCPKMVALDLSSTRDAYASELFKILEKEYNIAQSLHLVMLLLRKQLKWSSFGKVGIPILRYWFRGTRSFPLDMRCFLSSRPASVCETAAAKDSES